MDIMGTFNVFLNVSGRVCFMESEHMKYDYEGPKSDQFFLYSVITP